MEVRCLDKYNVAAAVDLVRVLSKFFRERDPMYPQLLL